MKKDKVNFMPQKEVDALPKQSFFMIEKISQIIIISICLGSSKPFN